SRGTAVARDGSATCSRPCPRPKKSWVALLASSFHFCALTFSRGAGSFARALPETRAKVIEVDFAARRRVRPVRRPHAVRPRQLDGGGHVIRADTEQLIRRDEALVALGR